MFVCLSMFVSVSLARCGHAHTKVGEPAWRQKQREVERGGREEAEMEEERKTEANYSKRSSAKRKKTFYSSSVGNYLLLFCIRALLRACVTRGRAGTKVALSFFEVVQLAQGPHERAFRPSCNLQVALRSGRFLLYLGARENFSSGHLRVSGLLFGQKRARLKRVSRITRAGPHSELRRRTSGQLCGATQKAQSNRTRPESGSGRCS